MNIFESFLAFLTVNTEVDSGELDPDGEKYEEVVRDFEVDFLNMVREAMLASDDDEYMCEVLYGENWKIVGVQAVHCQPLENIILFKLMAP